MFESVPIRSVTQGFIEKPQNDQTSWHIVGYSTIQADLSELEVFFNYLPKFHEKGSFVDDEYCLAVEI